MSTPPWNLQIYDGRDTTYNRLAYLTGIKDGGFSYTSTGNHMLIHMITGEKYGFEGFYAEYITSKNICKNQTFGNIIRASTSNNFAPTPLPSA